MQEKITASEFRKMIERTLINEFNKTLSSADYDDIYKATAFCVRRMMSQKQKVFSRKANGQGAKQVYYLCIEFLMGRSLKTNLFNLGLNTAAEEAWQEMGLDVRTVYDREPDAGLGNGGLGRLAACYMDGLAADSYYGGGYSILYEYGMFRQKIVNGWQTEEPDNWLPGGEVWLKAHPNQSVEVKFGGQVKDFWQGNYHHTTYTDYSSVIAVPYDMYVSGYDSQGVTKLRLWEAKRPSIDMDSFNRGDYLSAIKSGSDAELISKVLYPNDNHLEGKILRLKQQYFLCCASIQDIVTRHMAKYGTLENLADKVAIHINDTHPTLAIPELMRVLMDDCGYGWEQSFDIVKNVFAYTNHTVMPEALEKWDVNMFSEVLPRIYQIIVEMNRRARIDLINAFPGDWGKVDYMSLIGDGQVRTANICCYVCHTINGVSELHSQIIKDTVFHDYFLYSPEKFTNVTNGIAYRRWLLQSNPDMCEMLDRKIGTNYRYNSFALARLADFKDDGDTLEEILEIKHKNKERLAAYVKEHYGETINPDSIFDVQAKRLHEYKRQHLNVLNIIAEYIWIKKNPDADFVPKTYIFGAKAASGYYMAKQIIRLIFAVKAMVENDPDTRDKLHITFLENYSVTVSELLMPASEISEQISLAGTEASGTGNMKFMINGAVTLGTYDGANIEIKKACGPENYVQFGMLTPEVNALKRKGYNPKAYIQSSAELQDIFGLIENGINGEYFNEIYDNLINSDPYMVLADFESYRNAQKEIQKIYKDRKLFARMSLMNTAMAGKFSADRAIEEYAQNIWHLQKVK